MKDNRALRIMTLTVALAGLALLAACSDDDPAGPGAQADVGLTTNIEAIDFKAWRQGASLSSSFRIIAAEDNDGDVSGEVTLSDGGGFRLGDGGGAFTLAPGEQRTVMVYFEPEDAGVKYRGTANLGVGGMSVALEGFGSDYPYFRFTPTALSEGTIQTNYKPFAGDKVSVSYGTGRSHAKPEDWIDCNPSRWIFNGNGISESKVGFTFGAPGGTHTIDVLAGLEAEKDCVQFLIETDGTEHRYEDLTGCQGFTDSFSLGGGSHTIHVGTDQQGAFCSSDLHLRYVSITCRGPVVSEANWQY